MQSFRLNDPNRNPPHWSARIQPGQYAVSHFDYKTGTWRTAAGNYSESPEEEIIFVFDSLTQARQYCQDYVVHHSTMFCRIYDHRGSAEGLVAKVYFPKVAAREQGLPAARNKMKHGALHLLAGLGCLALDWRLGGPVILGVVVGSKFFTVGLVRLVQGVAGLLESREPESSE